MPTIGERIRSVREAKGLTQGDVASRLGVVHTTVGDYERASDLKHSVIKKLADALEVNHNYLTGDDPELEPLDVAIVVRRESLRIFLDRTKVKGRERRQFERVRDLPAAKTTIDGWRELRTLIHTFLGRPGRSAGAAQAEHAENVAARPPRQKKHMAKVIGLRADSRRLVRRAV